MHHRSASAQLIRDGCNDPFPLNRPPRRDRLNTSLFGVVIEGRYVLYQLRGRSC